MNNSKSPSTILEFKNVTFSYDNLIILKNVSCHIQEGEFIGIIGPNGGGKTTFLKLVMGFLSPTSGSIQLFGASPQLQKNKIAYVPQILRFDKKFPISVNELILSGRLSELPFYGRYNQSDREDAKEILSKMRLDMLKDRPIGTLSGGQMQRALIGRALIAKPKLLLLDEPTANVDAQAESEIYSILKELRGQITIAMVTHNLKASINLVEKVLCIQTEVSMLKTTEVCEHFALGLYHTPLLVDPKKEECCAIQVEKEEAN